MQVRHNPNLLVLCFCFVVQPPGPVMPPAVPPAQPYIPPAGAPVFTVPSPGHSPGQAGKSPGASPGAPPLPSRPPNASQGNSPIAPSGSPGIYENINISPPHVNFNGNPVRYTITYCLITYCNIFIIFFQKTHVKIWIKVIFLRCLLFLFQPLPNYDDVMSSPTQCEWN